MTKKVVFNIIVDDEDKHAFGLYKSWDYEHVGDSTQIFIRKRSEFYKHDTLVLISQEDYEYLKDLEKECVDEEE